MNSIGILEIIAVYGSAFIILLLLIATFVIRIIRENKRKKKGQLTAPAQISIPVTYPPDISGIPDRVLTSSDFDDDGRKQNITIENIEMLSTLKRSIIWAEILGRPGGRRRRNT